MTDAMAKKRWVSFYEIYGTPDGDGARLGTGIYKDVFARDVGAPRIGCFFSHVTNAYLRGFATFSLAHFDESKNEFVCDYASPFEKMGGPLWLFRMSDRLIAEGLACIPHELPVPPEGYWVDSINANDYSDDSRSNMRLANKTTWRVSERCWLLHASPALNGWDWGDGRHCMQHTKSGPLSYSNACSPQVQT